MGQHQIHIDVLYRCNTLYVHVYAKQQFWQMVPLYMDIHTDIYNAIIYNNIRIFLQKTHS